MTKSTGKGRGGTRAGGGRPTGILTLTNRLRAAQIAKDGGILPIDVMIGNMRFWYAETGRLTERIQMMLDTISKMDPGPERDKLTEHAMKSLGRMLAARDKSEDCAVDAAPYFHARLSSVVPPDDDAKNVPTPLFEVGFIEKLEAPVTDIPDAPAPVPAE